MIEDKENKLKDIGKKLIKCDKKCDGVFSCLKSYIPPRGLYLQIQNTNPNGKPVIIVGMNPGRMKEQGKEAKFYSQSKNLFESQGKYIEEILLDNHSYHKNIRKILELLGFDGPVLWTEIVKCQSKEDASQLPINTIRNCVHNFLTDELKYFSWDIIALGNESYRTCSLLFPKRKIIGVPHPSGANRGFKKFIEKLKENKERIKRRINQLDNNEAIHLKDEFKKI